MVPLAGSSLSSDAGIITNPLTQKLGYKKIIKENFPRSTGGREARPSANTLCATFIMKANCFWAGSGLSGRGRVSLLLPFQSPPQRWAPGEDVGRRPGGEAQPWVLAASALDEQARECQPAVEIDSFFAETERCARNRWQENGALFAGKCQPMPSAPICCMRKLSLGPVRGGGTGSRRPGSEIGMPGTGAAGGGGGVPKRAYLGSGPKASVVPLPGCPAGGLTLSLSKERHS